MKVRFFDPGKQYLEHREEYLAVYDDVRTRGKLVLQEELEEFEQNLANYVGKKHAIGLNSGTDALYLSLWALGIGEGDEVIVPSHTFVATAQVVAQLGATPVLVDVGDNLLIGDFTITEKTKAIIPVHLTGAVATGETCIPGLLGQRGIHIVEDAAQALGALGVGYGITQCYSFYPAKILGAPGDAGAITTDDDALADELRQLRHHYKRDYSKWGINSRLDNVLAAELNLKMKYLPEMQLRRARIAMKYREGLRDVPLKLPEYSEGRVWQDYVVRIAPEIIRDGEGGAAGQTNNRDRLYEYLKEAGIETMKNEYPFPIQKLPNSLRIEAETLRIPCNDVLTDEEVDYVIETINKFFSV